MGDQFAGATLLAVGQSLRLRFYYFFIVFHLAKTLAEGNWRILALLVYGHLHKNGVVIAWCTWQLLLHARESGSRLW